jgi:hypothetical protein
MNETSLVFAIIVVANCKGGKKIIFHNEQTVFLLWLQVMEQTLLRDIKLKLLNTDTDQLQIKYIKCTSKQESSLG